MLNLTEGAIAASFHVEEPIRAELFGPERLEQHAETLAAADRVTEKPTRGRDLLARVRYNGRGLLDAYHSSVEAVGAKREITLATGTCANRLISRFGISETGIRTLAGLPARDMKSRHSGP